MRGRVWVGVLVGGVLLAVAVAAALVLAGRSGDPRLREPRDVADLAARVDRVVRTQRRDSGDGAVPQVAVAIVHDGGVVWSRAYGDGATTASRFQVGSISKPAAAIGLLRLARETGLDLDAPLPVSGWQVPDGVTLRRLLSHTAGLSVPGYIGLDPARPLPTTLAELNGEGEAPAVRATADPGTTFSYSGGGYAVAQLWAEQAARRPFAETMDATVLRPLGMSSASFGQDPTSLTGHDAHGRPLPDYRYAALAAAGLHATAPDVGRLLAFVLSDDALARTMRTPAPATDGAWGMGIELRPLAGRRTLVEHEGVNRGWHARMLGEPRSGWGLVVLTDADASTALIDAVTAELIEQ